MKTCDVSVKRVSHSVECIVITISTSSTECAGLVFKAIGNFSVINHTSLHAVKCARALQSCLLSSQLMSTSHRSDRDCS